MITNRSISTWMKTEGEPVMGNSLFYKTQDFALQLARKEVKYEEKAKVDFLLIPDADLAELGIRRGTTVARLCGDYVELFFTTSGWIEGKGATNTQARDKDEEKAKVDSENACRRSAKRAMRQVRRLVNRNYLRYMWTLTFAPDSEPNRIKFRTSSREQQANIAWVRERWRGFYTKLRRRGIEWKWLVVYELHNSASTSEGKRGTWHIHFATDVRLDWEWVGNEWGFGYVRFDDFAKPKAGVRKTRVENPGAYMSKYVGKAFDKSNFHVKRYSRSRNMQTPEKIDLARLLEIFPNLSGLKTIWKAGREFESDKPNGEKWYAHNITFRKEKGYDHQLQSQDDRWEHPGAAT